MPGKKKWLWIPVSIVALALAYLTLKELYREPLARRARALEAALPAGRALLDSFGLPEGVRPYEVRQERPIKGKSLRAEFTEVYWSPGRFADLVAWYRTRLEANGWKPFDRKDWNDFHVDFCRAPWLLTIQQDASFEQERPPFHRYRLRLEWRWGFESDRCPLPE